MSDDGPELMAIPLGQLFGQQQRQPKKPPKPAMPLVQAMELLGAYAKSQEQHPIILGELYVEKDGVGIFSDDTDPDNRVIVLVWRVLQKDDEVDYYIARSVAKATRGSIPDIIIARQHEGELLLMPYESWRLEPYTGRRE